MKCRGCLRLRRRRWSEENGFFVDERRAEKSRVHFVGVLDVIGTDSTSSAHLNHSETGNLGGSGLKICSFSTFWLFFVKSVDVESVSRAVTMGVGAGDSVDGLDSKSARDW